MSKKIEGNFGPQHAVANTEKIEATPVIFGNKTEKEPTSFSVEAFSEITEARGTLRNVKSAIKKRGSTPATLADLQILQKRLDANPDSEEAEEYKDGSRYYAFGTRQVGRVPCLYWGGGRFQVYWYGLWRRWLGLDCALLK